VIKLQNVLSNSQNTFNCAELNMTPASLVAMHAIIAESFLCTFMNFTESLPPASVIRSQLI